MSVYLAWSLYKLTGVLLFITAVTLILLYTGKKQDSIKNYKKVTFTLTGVMLLFTILAAFNIGDRQQELGRSSFNTSQPEEVSKVTSNAPDVESVNKTFESVVKKTQ